jgi:hypothetical protein
MTGHAAAPSTGLPLVPPLVLAGRAATRWDWRTPNPLVRDLLHGQRRPREIYDIFEGTEQIQQLVIARAISGLRIE